MLVYVLLDHDQYEGDAFMGVYSTREAAFDAYKQHGGYGGGMKVCVVKVDDDVKDY